MQVQVPGARRHPGHADRRGRQAGGELSALLDDEAALRSADPQRLLDAYLSIDDQLLTSYRWARDVEDPSSGSAVRSVTFCAMGGSAAAGDVIAAAYMDTAPVPIGTVRGYGLPAHCGEEDLVACVSYSGNTEEPLSAYGEAVRRGCRVVAISSGGALADRARRDGAFHVPVPPDCPQPRAALGHLTGAALGALAAAGILERKDEEVEQACADLHMLIQELGRDTPTTRNRAKEIAAWIGDRFPVIWGSQGVSEPAAWRWKCAFNENAKIPAFSSALPELDHHEVAGWSKGTGDGFALVVLREPGEHETVAPRLEATLEQIEPSGMGAREAQAEGRSPLARALSLMLVGDTASAYHALARGIDPAPIEAIAGVKARLAESKP